jgi:WD40 repeat protein
MGEMWNNYTYRLLSDPPSLLCVMGLNTETLVFGTDHTVRITSLDNGTAISEARLVKRTLALCGLTNQEFFSSGDYHEVIHWRVEARELVEVRRFDFHEDGGVFALTLLSPTRLLSGDRLGMVAVWDLESGTLETNFKAHDVTVYTALSLSKTSFVTGSKEKALKVWEKRERKKEEGVGEEGEVEIYYEETRRLPTKDETAIGLIAVTPRGHRKGSWRALASWEGCITVYDENWEVRATSLPFRSLYFLCEVCPGVLAATCNSLVIWDYQTGIHRQFSEIKDFHTSYVTTLIPSGELLVADSRTVGFFKFSGLDWEKVFQWLFLGREDEGSRFWRMPEEVLFHFVGVMKEHLGLF